MARRPIWRSPFFWATLAGLILVPLSRPLLRFEPPPPPVTGQLPRLELVDQDGKPFPLPDPAGRILVLSFFFTRCSTVCPLLGEGLASLSRRYSEAAIDGIDLASITVDPRHDGPRDLRAWGEQYGFDAQRWHLLTGESDAIRGLVESLGLELGTPVELGRGAPGRVDVAHPDRLVLVDGAGRVRGLYHSDARGRDEVFHRSQHVLKEGGHRTPRVRPEDTQF